MDFDKIKTAVGEIELSDLQRQKILDSCKEKKRKFNYKPLVAVAAVLVVIVIGSPGFLFRAGEKADNAVRNEEFDLFADNKDGFCVAESQAVEWVFGADGFQREYCVVPSEFSSLVSEAEFTEWKMQANADNGMAMMQFVMFFGISRESFDRANADYVNRTGSDGFNADIIYTFNKETVDELYAQ